MPGKLAEILEGLGRDLSAARRIRRITQEDMAQRLGVSRKLISRMEKGDPRVSLGAHATAAWLMRLEENLANIFAPETDPEFQRQVRLSQPKRVRNRTGRTGDLDL